MESSDIEYRKNSYRVVLRPDHVSRQGDCRDCWYLHGYVSLWCKNQVATEAHGTSVPGRTDCKFWKEALRGGKTPKSLREFEERLRTIFGLIILGTCLLLGVLWIFI